MSFAGSLQHREVHVWQVNLDDAIWDGFYAVLCPNEQEKTQRFRSLPLQKHYARCRSALRLILGRYANRAAADLQFCYGEFGKPQLLDQRLHFNVSHSGGYGLIAVSLHEIGIDLELIAETNVDLPGLIELVCHADEKAMLNRMPDVERSHMFYRLWTQKEAYCKMLGTGLQQSLSAMHVVPSVTPTVFQVKDQSAGRDRPENCFVYSLNLLKGYAASTCLPLADARLAVFQA